MTRPPSLDEEGIYQGIPESLPAFGTFFSPPGIRGTFFGLI
jgi:hypothetical protein